MKSLNMTEPNNLFNNDYLLKLPLELLYDILLKLNITNLMNLCDTNMRADLNQYNINIQNNHSINDSVKRYISKNVLNDSYFWNTYMKFYNADTIKAIQAIQNVTSLFGSIKIPTIPLLIKSLIIYDEYRTQYFKISTEHTITNKDKSYVVYYNGEDVVSITIEQYESEYHSNRIVPFDSFRGCKNYLRGFANDVIYDVNKIIKSKYPKYHISNRFIDSHYPLVNKLSIWRSKAETNTQIQSDVVNIFIKLESYIKTLLCGLDANCYDFDFDKLVNYNPLNEDLYCDETYRIVDKTQTSRYSNDNSISMDE